MHDSSRRRAHRIQLRPHLTRLHTLQNQTETDCAKQTKNRAIVKLKILPLNTKILYQSRKQAKMHNTCPKCSAAIAGGSKTCGSCGSVRTSFGTLVSMIGLYMVMVLSD